MKKGKTRMENFIPNQRVQFCTTQKNTYGETVKIITRLYIQNIRKPSTFMISIIQPLLWLVMFGALFQNAPIYLFENYKVGYKEFLNPGIIIFTAFNSSINAGLAIIFDREFGFLNRILISPISNKNSLIYSCIIHTWVVTMIQILCITIIINHQNHSITNLNHFVISIVIASMVVISISNISICNAFILPGHIEFIGLTTLLLNLPTLFTSTALAPLSFMPNWLQVICSLNPLTHAIEIIRSLHLKTIMDLNGFIINTSFIKVREHEGILLLILSNIISFVLAKKIIKYKYDKT